MPTTTCFEFKVADMFRFRDGRIVFVGSVAGEVPYIGPGKCELVVNGQPTAVIQLEGEMITDRPHPIGLRSVATRDEVALDGVSPSNADCRLRSLST